MADESKRTVLLEFEVDVDQSIESINKLTAANKALRAERNNLNIATDAGKARAAELNAQIDSNTAKIKQNVSAIEQQKINIGNYKSALDGVVPGMGKFNAVTDKGTKAVQLFKLALGPIGIAIALITAALTLLTKYLFGTQEGMDKVTAITRPLAAIFERLMGVVQVLGGKLFKQLAEAVKNPIQAFKDLGDIIKDNIIKRFEALALFGPALKKIFAGDIADGFKDLGNATIQATTGIENGIDKITDAAKGLADFVDEAYQQGLRLDALQKAIERGEIDQIVRTKELNLLIKQQKAIVEDETKSYDARIVAAQRARKAQDEALRIELALQDKRIEKIRLQQSLNDTSREDEKELAELVARRLELQATATEQAIEFDKKINEIRKKETEEIRKQNEARLKLLREQEGAPAERPEIAQEFQTAKAITDIRQRMVDEVAAINKKADREELARAERRAEVLEQIEFQKMDAAIAVSDGILGLLDEQSAAYKAVATAQTVISTYAAAQKAYEAAFLPVATVASPALGVAFAAAAVLKGLANVAAINGVEFAEGGYTGPGRKFDPAGIVHKNEYVTPSHIVNSPAAKPHLNALERMRTGLPLYADGGLVASAISQPINQQFEISNILKSMPAPEVAVVEVSKMQRRVRVKEQTSKR